MADDGEYLFFDETLIYGRDKTLNFNIATWNINSVRLRADLVCKLLKNEKIDVLCLQECKSPVDKSPLNVFSEIGFPYLVARGQKGYNGVAIVSKFPLFEKSAIDFAGLGHARHIAAQLEIGVTIHNFYVPAGGDEPDRERNEKFDQKLIYLSAMKEYFCKNRPRKSILVGDLNIAPLPEDVWDHKKMAKIVSHTQIEIDHLDAVQRAGKWIDVTRKDIPKQKLYSWWSYRAKDWDASDRGRRLDHIWASEDIASNTGDSRILIEVRGWERPSDHVPVFATINL